MIRTSSLILTVLFMVGCSSDELLKSAFEVESRQYTFEVAARGVLEPSEAISINMPRDVSMRFNILWLIPEYSEVGKGQVIARFDESEIQAQRSFNFLAVANQQLLFDNHSRSSDLGRALIYHETMRVDGETDIAENFVDVDPRYFSKNEIIDAIGDLDYLGVQETFYGWQANTHDRRTLAETSRLSAQRQATELMLEKQNAAMEYMELKSPENGTFVYARTPWGEKISKGQTVYPGRPVGLLPIRGKVRARVYVPEIDAVGIEIGQEALLRLDSNVERTYTASVTSVSPVATAPNRDDPRRFFLIKIDIDDVDPKLMRVGSNLTATIITGKFDEALLLPQQAVFFDEGDPFVYVIEDSEPMVRKVTVGKQSPTLVEIKDGLIDGERISLTEPFLPTT